MPDLYGSRELKQRDWDIIELVSLGLTNREIAGEIGVTEMVVKNYLRSIFDKLGVWTRLELALWFTKHSLPEPGKLQDKSTDIPNGARTGGT